MSGHSSPPAPDLIAAQRCLNCAAELSGRYCAQCGQDAHRHVLSLRQTAAELLEDISAADARVWRTLRLLALRPGELTCEYLRGKRASYTPPLRLYVALSLLLFLVSLLPDAPREARQEPIVRGTTVVALTPDAIEALDGALQGVDERYRSAVREQITNAVAKVPAAQQVRAVSDLAGACGAGPLGLVVLNNGIGAQLAHEELVANCKKVARPGEKFLREGSESASKMMVFFLPLIALFGKLLYLGSRRYYIGHLIFFVHFHAFVFLMIAADGLVDSLAGLGGARWLKDVSDVMSIGVSIWITLYLYKAMRRVYGQGPWVTRFKFLLLAVGYLINFVVAIALLVAWIALQSGVGLSEWQDIAHSLDFLNP